MNIFRFVSVFILSLNVFGSDIFGSTNLNNPIQNALNRNVPVLVKFEMSRGCAPCIALDRIIDENLDKDKMEVATIDLLRVNRIKRKRVKNCSIYNDQGDVDQDETLYSKFVTCLYIIAGTPAYLFLDPSKETVLSLDGNNYNRLKYKDLLGKIVYDKFNPNDSNSTKEVINHFQKIYSRDDHGSSISLKSIYSKFINPSEGESLNQDNNSLLDKHNELRGFELRLKDFELELKLRESKIKFSEENLKRDKESYKRNLNILNERLSKVIKRENEVMRLQLKLKNTR